MGLLDKFFKKQQQQQLDALSAKGKSETNAKRSATPAKTTQAAKEAPTKERAETKGKKKDTKKEAKGDQKQQHALPRHAYRTIVRPLITEKGTDVTAFNQYTFEVRPGVNKHQVRQAIRELYDVVPTQVRILNVRGNVVRFGRSVGTTKGWRKAIVRLPEGKTIQIAES